MLYPYNFISLKFQLINFRFSRLILLRSFNSNILLISLYSFYTQNCNVIGIRRSTTVVLRDPEGVLLKT